ncbi:serine/arginine repetitive matrix protein 1-like [Penaeus chinensis]|uniref:serine/arginine repetitive matrix protein 1-like n=1 Tax=Penaeus chinensis TaxID=139456 RepID=UPI001FB60EBB|nr:serine/arginine repetitive matrix protein 1-like [Penaeus chinensis]
MGSNLLLFFAGKCGGVTWRKRGAGRVSHDRPRTRTPRRGHYRTPSRPTRRILTRLEKQSSSEDSCSSSSSSSACTTPDRRPTRPSPRQNKVQTSSTTKSREAELTGQSASSISGEHSSRSNSSTNRPTPSPPSPPSPPAKAAVERATPSPPSKASAAASPPKGASDRPGKRGSPNNGATRRPPQRCRSVSPGTRAAHFAAATQCSNKNNTNNENNRNTGNCENNSSKSQKRKSNASPSRGHNSAPRHAAERESRPVSPAHHSHSKTSRKDSHSTDGSSSEEPVVIYEKTTYRPPPPDAHRTPLGSASKEAARTPQAPPSKDAQRRTEAEPRPKEDAACKPKSSPVPAPSEAPRPAPPRKEEAPSLTVSSGTPPRSSSGRSPSSEGVSTAPREESSDVSVVCAVRAPEELAPRCLPKALPLDEVRLPVPPGACRSESAAAKSLPPDVVIVPADPPHEEPKCQRERATEGAPRVCIASEPPLDLARDHPLGHPLGHAHPRTTEGPAVPSPARECKRPVCSSATTSLSVCSRSGASSVNNVAFCPGDNRVSEAAVSARSSASVASVDQGRFVSAAVSHHDTGVKNGVVGHSASSVVVSSVTAPICDGVTTVPSVTSVSIVAGTPSAIVSAVAWSSESNKVNTTSSNSSSGSVCSSGGSGSSRGCGEVAGVVSGRAVTITATSGPGPTCASRVASPPCVSITAVVRTAAAPAPAAAAPAAASPAGPQ